MRRIVHATMLCIVCTAITLTIVRADEEKELAATPPQPVVTPKEWNFMVYLCSNNNLYSYYIRNFHQLEHVGSTPFVNIILQLDKKDKKEVLRYFIDKNKPTIIETVSNNATSFSGTPENLFEFAKCGIKKYPANKLCLVLSNHGAGVKDPHIWGRMGIATSDILYSFNYHTGLLELNRNIVSDRKKLQEFLKINKDRGIAFNETAKVYLSNEDLKLSLERISKELLNGNKVEILAMDACYMGMIEIAYQVKDTVKIMVGSEEVEPGAGYNYTTVLKPLEKEATDQTTLAKTIVSSFGNEYGTTVGDFTQSAVDLTYANDLAKALHALALTLTDLLTYDRDAAIKALAAVRNNHELTTEFFDADYIDLGHFISNLVITCTNQEKSDTTLREIKPVKRENAGKSSKQTKPSKPSDPKQQWHQAKELALDTLSILQKMIIANTTGNNLVKAQGLAIYFPQNTIHRSYKNTDFAQATAWPKFLRKYVAVKKEHCVLPVSDGIATIAEPTNSTQPVVS